MPALESLPAPPTLNSRWSQLPSSANIQMELITRAAKQNLSNLASQQNTSDAGLPRVLPRADYANLGELLGQEQMAGTSAMLCHYRNNSLAASASAQPIPLVCQLGCCPHLPGGCCTMDGDPGSAGSSIAAGYHWVLALLCAFILCVFVSTVALLVLYWVNRRQELRRRRFLLAEKYSLGLGSSRQSSYGPPSLTSSSTPPAGPHPQQPPFCSHPISAGHYRQFYASNSPSLHSPTGVRQVTAVQKDCGGSRPLQHRQPYMGLGHQHYQHHRHQQQQQLDLSPPDSSSAYHAPDEVFFRSSF